MCGGSFTSSSVRFQPSRYVEPRRRWFTGREALPPIKGIVKATGTRRGDETAAELCAEEEEEATWEKVEYTRADDEALGLSKEAIERKWISMHILRKYGLEPLTSLPCIETSQDCTIRNSDEILERLMIIIELMSMVPRTRMGENEQMYLSNRKQLRQRFILMGWLNTRCCEEERTLLTRTDSEVNIERDINFCNWRSEDVWMLCHVLQVVDNRSGLLMPINMTNPAKLPFWKDVSRPEVPLNYPEQILAAILKKCDEERTPLAGQLRDCCWLLDQSDLLYRFHWCMVDAQLNGQAAVGHWEDTELACLITRRWRTVIDWVLFGYDYDKVPLHT